MSEEPSSAPANQNPRQQILIVDDHPVFRRGMAALLREQGEFEVCGEAEDSATALEAMRRLKPDLMLVDISMPGTNGIELIKLMLAEQPKLLILIVSMHEESLYALRSLRAGARGYVMKSEAITHVVEALHKVGSGGIYISPQFCERLVFKLIQSPDLAVDSPVEQLSDRELEVLRLIGQGTSTRDIAGSLHLSIKTIETHRAHIKEKLGLKDSTEMVRFAMDWVAQQEG